MFVGLIECLQVIIRMADISACILDGAVRGWGEVERDVWTLVFHHMLSALGSGDF